VVLVAAVLGETEQVLLVSRDDVAINELVPYLKRVKMFKQKMDVAG
jgi:hypothetical protein